MALLISVADAADLSSLIRELLQVTVTEKQQVSFALFALMMLMSAFLLRLLNFNKLEQQISDMAEIDAEEKYRTTNSDAWQMSKP